MHTLVRARHTDIPTAAIKAITAPFQRKSSVRLRSQPESAVMTSWTASEAQGSRSVPRLGEGISKRILWGLGLGLGMGWLPVLFGSEVVGQVTGLYKLATGLHPYFQPTQAGLLYCITPVVVTSSFLLFLSPGCILVLALGQARSLAEWMVLAFGSSLLLSIVLSTGVKLALGTPMTSLAQFSSWLGSTGLAWLFLALRLRAGATLPWPMAHSSDIRRLMWILAASIVGIAALVPKIFWENFNVDGIEAFEFGRSLTTYIFPHWDIQDGVFGLYRNFILFAYPNHWFISLFGPVEAAARLPFILYLMVLFATLVLLIEWRGARPLTSLEEAVIWFGLTLYVIVQVYNTNYEPFFADIAEMAATDSLWVLCFLAACYALWSGRCQWFWVYALMTYLASPGGLLLLGTLAVVTYLSRSPNWREHLKALSGVILVCLFISLAYETFYNPLVLGSVNDQFSAKNMLRRLYPPTITEFVRLNALLFPSGLLPALSLLMVRRKEPVGWMLAGMTLIYFGVLYLQAWTSLHQFTPVMVLPLIVFWRLYTSSSRRVQRWLLPAVATTTALSLFLSLPRHFQINQAVREFGLATSYTVGDYEHSYERATRAAWSLSALLPEGYRLQYPEQPWGADPHSWIYYATREKPSGSLVNYVVQATSEPPPPEASQVMARDGVAVYVRDLEAWRRDRERILPRVVVSPLYEPILRRTYLFFRAYVEQIQQKARE